MKRMMLAFGLTCLGSAVVAESNYTAKPRGSTNVGRSQYTTGHGTLQKKPRNYDAYYYSNYNGYALSPYLLTTPENMPRALTPTRPYTDVEYGNIMEKFLSAKDVAAAGASAGEVQSIVQDDGDPVFGTHSYRPVTTKVMDVLDRGILMVASREEVRLRGVRIGSERSSDDVHRVYAREAAKRIRELTEGKQVSLILDAPLRDGDGSILVVAKLKDGTEINKVLLREGLGQLREDDFADDVNYEPLAKAEAEARAKRRGIWSRDFSNRAL